MNEIETITNVYEGGEGTAALESQKGSWISPEHPAQAPAPMAYAGVTVIVWLCFLRPFEWMSIIYGLHVGNLLGVISLFVIGSFVFGGEKAQLSSELKLLLLLAGQMCLATPFAYWRRGAFDILLHDVAITALMAAAVGLAVDSIDRLKRVIRIEAISLSVLTALTLIAGARDSEGRLVGVGGLYSNSNDLASILAVTVPFCIMFMFVTRGVLFKIFWACSAAMMLYAVNGTLSRSGLIALAVGLLVCLWNFAFKAGRRGAPILLALIVLSVLTMASSPKFRARLLVSGGNASDATGIAASASNSSLERQQLFWRAVDLMLHHPILGVGPGNFYTLSGGDYRDWHVSHNTYTQCGAEAGIPALLIFVFMLRTAVKHCKRTQKKPGISGDASALAIGLRASLLAYVVAAFFADTAYQLFPYFLIVLAGALWQIESAETSTAPESQNHPFESQISGGAELDALDISVLAG